MASFPGLLNELPGSVTQTSDAGYWNIDDTSQDLLNAAIASNDRSRRLDAASLPEPSKSITSSSSSSSKRAGSKRKPVREDSTSGKRSVDKTDANQTKSTAPKRPGRKPLEASPPSDGPVDPKQKRKEQNRAAQRAFRERKERHVAELQERIRQLEEEKASREDLVKENAMLKEKIRKLEEENYALKGTQFTFEFPPRIMDHDRSSLSSNSCLGSTLSSVGDKSSNCSIRSSNSEHDQATPGDDDDDDDDEVEDFMNHPLITANTTTISSSSSTTNNTFVNHPIITATTTNTAVVDQQQQQPINTDYFLDQPPSSLLLLPNNDMNNSTFAFGDYRVPPNSDSFLFDDGGLASLFSSDGIDLFGLSGPAPFSSDLEPTTTEPPSCKAKLVETLQRAKGQSRRAADVKRDLASCCPDIIDDLCEEMKRKAKCSDEVLTDKDVDCLINWIEHKKGSKK